ncbi:phospholipase/carboxylesterase [Rubricella aquisinus]|uniref:Phospholipase/carboxylesterase n=2 Tax=Rubricella aquisinus TaxID=2028108 RepID=A0A840X195_9RHOB|nr:prolyl oligopeptidase family serine peptidase [Rubricella aquisinus]MBB5515646.1 phospholipase/carboxylesterase [Rubricella aquisinus]
MATLTSTPLTAKSGTADSLVIFLHGYGADGADLLGLGEVLAPHMPNTEFHAPNAPERCVNNPMGYQWFPIPWMDGSTEAQMTASFTASVAALDAYLDDIASRTGIGPERTVLVGFSQGTMMSLHVGPRRADPLAGIVGFSGRLLAPEDIGSVISKPPVLLIHGDVDPVVPFAHMAEAATALRGAGFDVDTHTSHGTPHGIAPDGLSKALLFLHEHLA